MKSIGRRLLSSVCALAMVANSVAGVVAQDRKSEVFNGGFATAAQQSGDAFQFFSQEMSFDNRLVKGAPFSADIISETIQTLPDGNLIIQRSEGRIYRDSQGRTRNERTFQMGGSSERRRVINIIDPVTDASYNLDPETRIARKTVHFFTMKRVAPTSVLTPPFNPDAPSHQPSGVPGGLTWPETTDKPPQSTKTAVSGRVSVGEAVKRVQPVYPPIAKEVGVSGDVQVQILISETGEVIEAKAGAGHPALRSAAEDAARQWVFKPTELEGKPVKQKGVLTFKFAPPPPPTTVSPTAEMRPATSKKITVSGGVLQGKATRKVQPPYPAIAKAVRVSGAVQVHITISETGEVIEASIVGGHPLLREAAVEAARQWLFQPIELGGMPVKAQGILTFNFALGDEGPAPARITNSVSKYPTNTETLDKQMVEGVECEGTRAITTMPAGAIGNERPIETVNETWYSPELQMIILSKRSDPRFGESTYRVTNISRAEPDAALFQVPSDYTIIDSRSKKVEVDVKEFEEMKKKLKEQAEGARKPNNQ